MNITTLGVIVAGLVLLDVGLVVGFFVRRFLAYRGQRVLVCPDTRQPAGVELDAWLAARSVIGVDPTLRIKSCSRWPERQGCGQDCISQIEDDGNQKPETRNLKTKSGAG